MIPKTNLIQLNSKHVISEIQLLAEAWERSTMSVRSCENFERSWFLHTVDFALEKR